MKKQLFVVTLLILALGFAVSTHYACKKDANTVPNDQKAVPNTKSSDDRKIDFCAESCPDQKSDGCLAIRGPQNNTLILCGFGSEGICGNACGVLPLFGTKFIGIDPDWGYLQPLCTFTNPKIFAITNPGNVPVTVTLGLRLRNSFDELCTSQLIHTLPVGLIQFFRITEYPNGSCSISLNSCSSEE